MGNKGAVGIRFRIQGEDGAVGETYTYVHYPFSSKSQAYRPTDLFAHI
jgi:hypothetical protein